MFISSTLTMVMAKGVFFFRDWETPFHCVGNCSISYFSYLLYLAVLKRSPFVLIHNTRVSFVVGFDQWLSHF